MAKNAPIGFCTVQKKEKGRNGLLSFSFVNCEIAPHNSSSKRASFSFNSITPMRAFQRWVQTFLRHRCTSRFHLILSKCYCSQFSRPLWKIALRYPTTKHKNILSFASFADKKKPEFFDLVI